MRLVASPVGALVVVVGAQEIVHALSAMHDLGIGRPRRVVPLVMLARSGQRRQRLVDRRRRGRRWLLPVGGGPPNGVISASERNTSGRTSAHHAAIPAPKSLPTTAWIERCPNAATRPSASRP